jgi:GNAT superfamily N-acetyltransferase
MTSDVLIRKVDGRKESTAHCLLWLQHETLPMDDPLPADEGHWWIAYQGGNPVAFASLKELADGVCYLSRAGVLPHARGKGLQKRLIRTRIRHAKRVGADTVVTDTSENPASANSLIAEGFRMYSPELRWALPTSAYWVRKL